MIATEALGVGDDDPSDGFVVAVVFVGGGVLTTLYGEVTGGVDVDVLVGDDVGGGECDVAFGGAERGVATNRELRAGDGVGDAVAVAFVVVPTSEHLTSIVDAPA